MQKSEKANACVRSGRQDPGLPWGYSRTMNKNVDVGVAGSITMIVLTVAVVVLLRSFYKRFTNVRKDSDIQDN